MPVISLFSGSYCNEKQVVQEIGARTGYRLISDNGRSLPKPAVSPIYLKTGSSGCFPIKHRYSTA
jgi:hypothetical protein